MATKVCLKINNKNNNKGDRKSLLKSKKVETRNSLFKLKTDLNKPAKKKRKIKSKTKKSGKFFMTQK